GVGAKSGGRAWGGAWAPRRGTASWSPRWRSSWGRRRDAVRRAVRLVPDPCPLPANGDNRRGRAAGLHSMNGVPIFNRLALIGMGLIGSSIARAVRAQGAESSIVTTDRPAAAHR